MSSTIAKPVQWVPHPYQKRGIQLGVQQSAAGLLLDPGLGKTTISLAIYKLLKKARHVEWALVIAPLRPAYEVWPAEIDKWANFTDLKWTVLHGKEKGDKINWPADIYIINPEGLQWLFGPGSPIKTLLKRGPGALFIDESTKFKDSTTKRFKLLKAWLPKFGRRYILTGTVVPNGLMDLFGQMYILDGGRALGRYITHYRNNFFYQPNPVYEEYKWAPNPDAHAEIVKRISPLCLQLNAEDHLQMPELLFRNIYVTLPPKVQEIYAAVDDDFVAAVGDNYVLAANAAVAGGKCRQIANGAVYINDAHDYEILHDEKLDALQELVEGLQGAPLLVLYEFVHDLERILKRFPGTPYIGSGVSTKKVSQYVKDFNEGNIRMLVGHPASMGHGLNLQGACQHVCWFGITWNFEYYDQANRRVYRQGQRGKSVFVYHIVARGTKDEEVLDVLLGKELTQKQLNNALIKPV
jgi:SNF2 family DNA or RNA helicase